MTQEQAQERLEARQKWQQERQQEKDRVLDACKKMATEAGFTESQVDFIVAMYHAILVQFETTALLGGFGF